MWKYLLLWPQTSLRLIYKCLKKYLMDCLNDLLIWKYIMILMIMETYAVIYKFEILTLTYSQLLVVGSSLIRLKIHLNLVITIYLCNLFLSIGFDLEQRKHCGIRSRFPLDHTLRKYINLKWIFKNFIWHTVLINCSNKQFE